MEHASPLQEAALSRRRKTPKVGTPIPHTPPRTLHRMFPNDRPQTLGEEIANAVSHGLGAACAGGAAPPS